MRANQVPLPDNAFDVFALVADALSFRPGVHDRARPVADAAPAEPTPRRGWLDRLDRWFWQRRQRDVEAHLAQSADVFELEARMRDLERGFPSRYY